MGVLYTDRGTAIHKIPSCCKQQPPRGREDMWKTNSGTLDVLSN